MGQQQLRLFSALATLSLIASAPASAQAVDPNDPAFVIAEVPKFAYADEIPTLQPIEGLATTCAQVEIRLGRIGEDFVAPAPGLATEQIRLGELATQGPFTIRWSGLEAICRALETALAADDREPPTRFFIAPNPGQIDPITRADRRRGKDKGLTFIVSYEGSFMPVSQFTLTYLTAMDDESGLPDPAEVLAQTEVPLVRLAEGYVPWRPGVEPELILLSGMTDGAPLVLSAGAIQRVLEAVTATMTDTFDLMAVQVTPFEDDLGFDRRRGIVDLRAGRTELRLRALVGVVTEMRTIGVGERLPAEGKNIDDPIHEFIKTGSPVQPADPSTPPEERRNLLRKTELNDYLFFRSRHPGRRVDVALGRPEQDLGVALDYIVTENNPLLIYGQVSNTGTESTDTVRYRAGLFHNQLTSNDDILNLEFVATDIKDNYAVIGQYEAPVFDQERLRWTVNGGYSEYDASNVGRAAELFTSTSWWTTAGLSWNFHQDGPMFLDLVGGARYYHLEVNNAFASIEGDADFLLPYVGLALDRYTETAVTDASLTFEFNVSSVTNADSVELSELGRLLPDEDWVIMKWNFFQSFFLEPLLDRAAWEDVTTPGSTLAHELAFRFRGQYAFDRRLIPQLEQVAGGLYSVRGYPESVAVGDTVILGTAEYRFHVPRAMKPAEPREFLGQPFRAVPQYAYGRADWDLILSAFCDVGRTINSEPFSFEDDQTLIGVGVGAQLLYRRNLDLRVDWGFAMDGIDGEVNSGSNRVSFVATFLF